MIKTFRLPYITKDVVGEVLELVSEDYDNVAIIKTKDGYNISADIVDHHVIGDGDYVFGVNLGIALKQAKDKIT
jgi:hypothetical protein